MKNIYLRKPWAALALLWLLLGTALPGRAQVYYTLNDGAATTALDQLRRVNADGTADALLKDNFVQSAGPALVDLANNRVLVADIRVSQASTSLTNTKIVAVSLAAGNAVTTLVTPTFITGSVSTGISGMVLDRVNNYLYYTLNDGAATAMLDQLRRINLDGTGDVLIKDNFVQSAGALELDAANNRVLVADIRASQASTSLTNTKIVAVSLAAGNAVTTLVTPTFITGSVSTAIGDLVLDKVNNALYYTLNDGGPTAMLDQLRRINLNGTGDALVKDNFVQSAGPAQVDLANNRVLVADIRVSQASTSLTNTKIVAVSLAAGNAATTLLTPTFITGSTSTVVNGLALPEASLPTVATAAASSITPTSAALGGNVTADGGASVTGRGVVYSTNSATPPAIGGSGVTQDTNGSGTGTFSETIAGLTAGTTYYVRAYATNSVGTSYGAVQTFTTPTTVVSIVRANANPTNASSVTYTVTFANPVTGVTVNNFGLTFTGGFTTFGSVSSVSGSGTTYTVTVNTGAGSGTLQLNLVNASGLTPGVSGLTFNGETYNIDKTGPVVSSVAVPANATYKLGQQLDFTVNFNEATTVSTAGGTPSLGLTVGAAGRTATYVSGSPGTALLFRYTVTAGDLDTDGIVLAGSLAFNGGTLRDALGNNATLTLNSVPATTGILVDGVVPTVAISSSVGASGSTTTTAPIPFTVTFSENVSGFVAGDVTVTNGSITGGVVNGTSPGTTYTFTVTPTTPGTATTVNVPANVAQDAAGNFNTAAPAAYSITYNQPSTTVASVTRLTPSPTATAQVSYRVVFAAAVTGVTVSNFLVTGPSGAGIASVSGSGTTYTVTVNTGTGDGTLRLDVANGVGITPSVTNTPYTAGEVYTITKSFAAAPQLTIVGLGGTGSDVTAFVDQVQVLSGGSPFANALLNGSFESHDPLGNVNFGYNPTGASWTFNTRSGIAESGSAFTPTTPIPDGIAVAFVQSASGVNGQLQQNLAVPTGSSYQVSFQAAQRVCCTTLDQALNVFLNGVFVGTIQPGSSNYSTFTSATFSVTAPALTASISSAAGASGSTTGTAPIPFTVTFSAGVTGFTASDVVVTNGTLSGFGGSGATFTFNVTPAANGVVTVNVPANGAVDANNTGNTAASQFSITYSQPATAAPVVSTPANGSLTNTNMPTYGGTAPANSTVTIYVDGTSIGTTTATAGGSFSLAQPTALSQGSHTVYATAQSSGAAVSANSNTNTFTVDSVRPSVAITSTTAANGGATSNSPIAYTVTFSENVNASFVQGDITVTNGTISGFTTVTAGTTFAFNVTPTGNGVVTVNVPANVAQDGAGNFNTAAPQFSVTYNQSVTATPSVTSPANSSLIATTTPTYQGTAVAGSTVTVYVDGTSIGTTMATGTGSFSLAQPTALSQGSHTVRATAQASGSTVSANSATNTFTVDSVQPSVVITSSATSPTNISPIPVTVTFSEAVTGFIASDVTVGNGFVANFSGSGTTYTFNVFVASPSTVTINVAANVAQDLASNGNTAAPQFSIVYVFPVTAAPVVNTPANGSFTTATLPTYTGTAVAGSIVTVYVDGTSIGNTTATTSGTFSLVQNSALTQGSHTVYATAQGPRESVSANSNTNTFTVDSVNPTVAISSTATSPTSISPIPVRVAFSETVTGFVQGDVTVTGGSITGFTAVSGSVYTFNVTPSGNGTVTVNVPANVAQDLALNFNTAAPQFSILYNQATTAAPVVLVPANGSVTNNRSITISGTAPANSTVTPYLGSSALTPVTATASGTFTYTIPSSAPDGTYTARATAQSAGELMSGFSNTNTFRVDGTAPTVAISSTATSPTSISPIPVRITFSETVTGFVQGDVTVTGGAITGFTAVSGSVYTFNVTPSGNGTVTVDIPANVAQDLALNFNTAAPTYAITYTALITATSWTGTLSPDWFTAGNWSADVPTATVDATIPASAPFMPAIATGTATTKALTLNSGATLTQSGGALDVRANLTNNGTINATGGTVTLGTSVAANILGSSSTRFWNLTVNANGAQQSTSAATAVQRLLTLNGNFAPNGNPFTLVSDATGTALVVNNGSNAIVGTATVQRYIAPDLNPNRGYRHVAAPISNATVASLTTGSFTPVVNPAYNTSATPATTTSFPTVYGYDQARLATTTNNLADFDKGWFSPASMSDALTVGQGYTVNLAANQTWNFVGTPNNGTVTQTLARNSGATAAAAGLQLVGNPYPAPLDWSLVTVADRPNLDAVIYKFASDDPTNPYTGTYGFYQSGFGTISPVLALGQGFFVRVSAGQTTGVLSLKNSHRVTSYTNPTFHRTAETRPVVHLTLQGAGKPQTDDAFVYFETGATNGLDAEYDGLKLANPSGLNLSSSLSATERLCVNGLAPLTTTQRIVPLAVGVPTAGSYTLNATEVLNLATTPVYLRDVQTGAVIDLALQPSYRFTVSNASALITGRFELVFSPQGVLATAPAALAAQVGLYPNPASKVAFIELPANLGRVAVTAKLVDALGRPVQQLSLPAQGAAAHRLELGNLATGVYTLHLATSAGVVVKKLVVE